MTYDYKESYRRKLPHRHSPGSTLFITYRLCDSIPKVVVERWKAERELLNKECRRIKDAARIEYLRLDFQRRWFGMFERLLHEETGPLWLRDPRIACIVADSLHYHDGRSYDLHSYSVMPNHAHVLFTPFLNERSLTEIRDPSLRYESDEPTLGAIMKSLKGYTAHEANKILGRSG